MFPLSKADQNICRLRRTEIKAGGQRQVKVEEKIKLLEQLEVERKAFEASREELPISLSMRAAVSERKSVVSAAKKKCEKAFDKAAHDYLAQRKDLSAAKTVLAEKEQFFDVARPVQIVPTNLLQNGTVWTGTRTFPKGSRSPLTLHIETVTAEGFSGETEFNDGRKYAVKGQLKSQITFGTGKVGKLQFTYRGEIIGERMSLTFFGTSSEETSEWNGTTKP
jgi:hypothetical protein